MTMPRVVLASLWRDDAKRNLPDRVEHLLAKAEMYPNLRWLWVVGDSTDSTLVALIELAHGYDVAIRRQDSGILGDDMNSRLRRLSYTGNAIFANLRPGDDYFLILESDILAPYDLIPRLIDHAQAGRCPIAGWPTLEITPGAKVFYDTWGYRKDGVRFTNHPPYHPCYRVDEVFTVDSVGTMLMFHAEDAPHLCMTDGAFLDICQQLCERGRSIYVDPTLEVIQPHSLWVPRVA